MTETQTEIVSVPISSITVLNPRIRSRKIFAEIVASIRLVGLKKPITVSAREDGSGFDLVCGQGRLEAYVELGQAEIPAVVINASTEDCFVMSLVENLARRQHSSLEHMNEIGTLKQSGYSASDIATKVGLSLEYVYAACHLLEHGEERLLKAVETGEMPPTIAMEIAKAKEEDVQRALVEAYENKSMPGNLIVGIRKIIEQRNVHGKTMVRLDRRSGASGGKVTADSLVRAYRNETERQKLMVKKATVTRERLEFITQALAALLKDEVFQVLLRADDLMKIPRPLAERIAAAGAGDA